MIPGENSTSKHLTWFVLFFWCESLWSSSALVGSPNLKLFLFKLQTRLLISFTQRQTLTQRREKSPKAWSRRKIFFFYFFYCFSVLYERRQAVWEMVVPDWTAHILRWYHVLPPISPRLPSHDPFSHVPSCISYHRLRFCHDSFLCFVLFFLFVSATNHLLWGQTALLYLTLWSAQL